MLTRKELSLVLFTAIITTTVVVVAQPQPAKPTVLGSAIFDWNKIEAAPTKTGSKRQFFQAPTSTLDELECHVTTLNKGEAAHEPHKHPEEELVIVKEGTLEVLMNGEWKRCGAGSVIFHASNVLHGMRNVGDGQASYHVFKWFLPGTKQKRADSK